MPTDCSQFQIPSLTEALFIRATESPHDFAYAARGERVSWATLLAGVLRTVSALSAAGVGDGARCALVLPTSLDFVRSFYALQLLGAVPLAINPRAPTGQVLRRIAEFDCECVIVDDGDVATGVAALRRATRLDPRLFREQAAASRRSLPPPDPEALSHLQLTSGTDGSPKGVRIKHGNVLASLRASHDLIEPRPDDLLVGWLPLYHDMGLFRLVLQPLYFGVGCHLIDPSLAAMRAWLHIVSKVNGTLTGAPDFAYRLSVRLVKAGEVDLRSLRVATNGGEPVRLTSIRAFEEHFGVPGVVHPGYGLAEATLGVASVRPGETLRVDEAGNVACGRPLKGVDVQVVDDAGVPVPSGQSGRIVVRGPVVCDGYWSDVATTTGVLGDGWLDTGDIGRLDADGHLFVLGRARAMIKRAGASIAPREIEEVVDSIAGVRRSAAIGVLTGTEAWTEDLIVVAETERHLSEADRAALRGSISQRTHGAIGVAPRDVLLTSAGSIPRTSTGKIRYEELRALVTSDSLGGD